MENIDVFWCFPCAVDAAVNVGVVGRAIENGTVGFRSFDLRDYALVAASTTCPTAVVPAWSSGWMSWHGRWRRSTALQRAR